MIPSSGRGSCLLHVQTVCGNQAASLSRVFGSLSPWKKQLELESGYFMQCQGFETLKICLNAPVLGLRGNTLYAVSVTRLYSYPYRALTWAAISKFTCRTTRQLGTSGCDMAVHKYSSLLPSVGWRKNTTVLGNMELGNRERLYHSSWINLPVPSLQGVCNIWLNGHLKIIIWKGTWWRAAVVTW